MKPLAERMRPTRLEDVVGQRHLLAEGKPLERALTRGQLSSCLLWGPPGTGKTTLARLMAQYLDAHFVGLSAVSAGVKEIRQVAQEASKRQQQHIQQSVGTLLFLDEVHRFNKAQQDILLPFVEDGTLLLVGATTENPSFEVNSALRSRLQLFVLQPLDEIALDSLLTRALTHPDGIHGLELSSDARDMLIAWAGGDGRRMLGALEAISQSSQSGYSSQPQRSQPQQSQPQPSPHPISEPQLIDAETVQTVLGKGALAFDKGGEHFYNLISALHKSIRGCHPDAALYWLARMLGAGADPLYVARRLVRVASEDVGLADPNALRLAIAAKESVTFLGQPEGDLALAQLTVYLAVAPKSNAIYRAWSAALADAERYRDAEVPLNIRNAPTALMKNLDYGKGYSYYFDDPEGSFKQPYFPDGLSAQYYNANGEGWEVKVKARLEEFAKLRKD
ncbi:MAG: replication-associated recombination protein A [Deinococcota bacterium]